MLEFQQIIDHKIRTYRVFLSSILHYSELRENDKALLFKSPHSQIEEISVVYFRTGYLPDHYPSSIEWSARLLIEESRAIKCPTIITQLAGSKKIQQLLCEQNIIENFLPKDISETLKKTFVPIYPLNANLSDQNFYHLLINNPQHYILKPQREGGGHNIYGSKILDFLETIPDSHKQQYILMERIYPPSQINTIIQDSQFHCLDVVNELGIYESGYLLRTKDKNKDEGGVIIGCSSIDSCFKRQKKK
ncbi:hypothetical protein PCK2_000228 [Pneumocystis canis]|nr:hypothetical protein PCK2_000228 [Pneumocystis canis]